MISVDLTDAVYCCSNAISKVDRALSFVRNREFVFTYISINTIITKVTGNK